MISHPGVAVWAIAVLCFLSATMLMLVFGVSRSKPVVQRFRRVLSVAAVSIAAMVVVAASVYDTERERSHEQLIEASRNGQHVTAEVLVVGYPKYSAAGIDQRSWVKTRLAEHPFTSIHVWLPDDSGYKHLGHHMRLRVTGSLSQNQAHDQSAFSLSAEAIETAPNNTVAARAGAIAAVGREKLVEVSASQARAVLVPGFAVGDTSLVSASIADAMLQSSLTHLTAVSGSNTALVITSVSALLSWLGFSKRGRLIAAGAALAAFVFLVGPDPSVQRAAVMAGVLLASKFGSQRSHALPSLGAAMLVLLIIDPWQAMQAGFGLSVLATAGILLLAHPISTWLKRRLQFPRLLALPLAVAIAAQVAVGPLLLLLQPGIPLAGVLANIIAAPAAPIGTLCGMCALLFGFFSATLADFAVWLASWPSSWVVATAEVISAWQFTHLHWPQGTWGALTLLAVQSALVVALLLRRRIISLPFTIPGAPPQLWNARTPLLQPIRWVSSVLIACSCATVLSLSFIAPGVRTLSTPQNWLMVACDVGQGDAILIRDPEHAEYTMLIDTGDDPRKLTDCLETFDVQRISMLVLSHDDRDHVGALHAVLPITERALISQVAIEEKGNTRTIVEQLTAANIEFEIANEATSGSFSDTSLSWSVLGPKTHAIMLETNETSIVLKVKVANHSILCVGDIGEAEQRDYLDMRTQLSADVLKVTHHGSRDYDDTFVKAVSATWGIISVGADNNYGHPAAQTLKSLARAETTVLRTDKQGSIALSLDAEGNLMPWVERVSRE